MICAPRLLKCGKPFADYGFTTFQQPLLLLRRQRKPLCLSPYFRRLVVLTKGSTLLSWLEAAQQLALSRRHGCGKRRP